MTDATSKARQGSRNQNWVVQEEKMKRGCSSAGARLVCLYYIPWVSCYGSVPVSAERGLTKRVKEKEGERGPRGNTGSQKIYFTHVHKPVFQAATIQAVGQGME